MKYNKKAVSLGVFICMCACHKSTTEVAPASLNIINAIADSQAVIPILNADQPTNYFVNAEAISYTNAHLYSPPSGSTFINIAQITDTVQVSPKFDLFSGTFNLLPGAIYSLFLTGDTTALDTMFVRDNIPPYYTDSLAGVRFVNLSPGSLPISITIEGNPSSQTEFSGVGYKSITSFKTYAANNSVANSSYLFVVRDQATGDSLASYSWSYTLFKNNTLIISGSESSSSTTPLQVFQMNNY